MTNKTPRQRQILERIIYCNTKNLKCCRRHYAYLPLIAAKSQNLTPKCKILNVFLYLTWSKVKDFFQLAFKSQKKFFLNGFEIMQNMIQMALKIGLAVFFQKTAKWLGALASDPNSLWVAGGRSPQALSVIHLSCTNLPTMSWDFDKFVKLYNLRF